MSSDTLSAENASSPHWQPLSRIQRRVLGVLIEKAKTTPDQYPLSLNGLTNGCNQKSNRSPQMQLNSDEVEIALDELRQLSAVAEVQGDGRVPKYRHYAKEWLGVEGNELAVMAELMLRGSQTVGDLRGRAARMGKIAGLSELKPLLASLATKKLVIELSPSGRGQTVTHGLFTERELEKEQRLHGDGQTDLSTNTAPAPTAARAAPTSALSPTATDSASVPSDVISEMRIEMAHLRTEMMRLRKEVEELWANIR